MIKDQSFKGCSQSGQLLEQPLNEKRGYDKILS